MAKLVSAMTAAECSAYEREVQSATRREMEVGQPGFAYELRGVELWGSCPDTEVVVRYQGVGTRRLVSEPRCPVG